VRPPVAGGPLVRRCFFLPAICRFSVQRHVSVITDFSIAAAIFCRPMKVCPMLGARGAPEYEQRKLSAWCLQRETIALWKFIKSLR